MNERAIERLQDKMDDHDILICTLEEKLKIATEALERISESSICNISVVIATSALTIICEIEDRDESTKETP